MDFRRYLSFLALAVLGFSASAHAERPYGMAGCGLGSVITGRSPARQIQSSLINISGNFLSTAGAISSAPLFVNSAPAMFALNSGSQWPALLVGSFALFSVPAQNAAITSGTSNCTPDASPTEAAQQSFMFENYATLAKEMAQGSGASIDGLANVLGCEESIKQEFFAFTQREYHSIFASAGALAALNKLKDTLLLNDKISHSCKNIAVSSAEIKKL